MLLEVKAKLTGHTEGLRAGALLQRRARLREAWCRRGAEAWAAYSSGMQRAGGLRGICKAGSVTLEDGLIVVDKRIVNEVTSGAWWVVEKGSSGEEHLGVKIASSISNRWSWSSLWDIQVRVLRRQ